MNSGSRHALAKARTEKSRNAVGTSAICVRFSDTFQQTPLVRETRCKAANRTSHIEHLLCHRPEFFSRLLSRTDKLCKRFICKAKDAIKEIIHASYAMPSRTHTCCCMFGCVCHSTKARPVSQYLGTTPRSRCPRISHRSFCH